MRKLYLLILCCIFLSGCVQVAFKKYDPETSRQITITVQYEQDTMKAVILALMKFNAPQQVIDDLKLLSEAEFVRLQSWLNYEESKKVEVK